MSNKDSLICAYILDGKGGGTKIGWKEVDTWTPDKGPLWVHLDFTKPKTKKWLLSVKELDKHVVMAMTADESRPRSLLLSNGLYLCLRGVNTNPGEDPEDMVSIRMYLNHDRIITTRKRSLTSVEDVRQKIESGNGPKTTADLLLLLTDRIAFRISDTIDKIDDELDQLEEEVLATESRSLRPKLAELRRECTLIRRNITPQREAIYRLQIEATSLLSDSVRQHLRELVDRLLRSQEDLDTIRDRATITQDELSTKVAERMDERMYALSIVALIFLPLSFITGLLGINTGGIPGAGSEKGFLITCVILLVIGIATLIILKIKKWL